MLDARCLALLLTPNLTHILTLILTTECGRARRMLTITLALTLDLTLTVTLILTLTLTLTLTLQNTSAKPCSTHAVSHSC